MKAGILSTSWTGFALNFLAADWINAAEIVRSSMKYVPESWEQHTLNAPQFLHWKCHLKQS